MFEIQVCPHIILLLLIPALQLSDTQLTNNCTSHQQMLVILSVITRLRLSNPDVRTGEHCSECSLNFQKVFFLSCSIFCLSSLNDNWFSDQIIITYTGISEAFLFSASVTQFTCHYSNQLCIKYKRIKRENKTL